MTETCYILIKKIPQSSLVATKEPELPLPLS